MYSLYVFEHKNIEIIMKVSFIYVMCTTFNVFDFSFIPFSICKL